MQVGNKLRPPVHPFEAILLYERKGNPLKTSFHDLEVNSYQHTKLHHCSYITLLNLQHILCEHISPLLCLLVQI